MPGVPAWYDAGINRGLGVPSSEAGLVDKRNELRAMGVDVTDVVDHDWAKSIYFQDPNGIQLEYCCLTRDVNADDARMQYRFDTSIRRLNLDTAAMTPDAGTDAESDLNADEPANALWPWK